LRRAIECGRAAGVAIRRHVAESAIGRDLPIANYFGLDRGPFVLDAHASADVGFYLATQGGGRCGDLALGFVV
jgi:hypothetical protein